MPWLDTSVESTIEYSQICPGWIQVSNLQLISHRCALARYRYRIRNLSSIDMPWLDTGIESINSSCRHALAGYRCRIYNQLLTDMPWLDTGIESRIGRLQICPGWIQVSNLELRRLIVIIVVLTFVLKRQNVNCMPCHDV